MRICVYAGSNPGTNPAYGEAAERFGRLLAERGIGLVYGGGRTGLMGRISDAVLAAGGTVTGIIPQFLMDKEVGHMGVQDLRVVGSMHERKALMAELSDGFVALPGGIGTLEEIFEVWTWAQLGRHDKPCGLLNAAGFYDGLAGFLDHVAGEQFMKPKHRSMLVVEESGEAILDAFAEYQPPVVEKWLDKGRT
ncbi:TIGR00730 family Rossman fold protein [Azospirillum soli]|uniref:LOG family protein n=1 Tax=Azospirillum soli TaxID=1304799 RepID=UPI001AE27A16|nr:TIGR00730 family Rossman fold protein [Azospirillum soli]MBP2313749.1 uncharacterized protein (TIGR00730 family) [Azospirillum soli]